MALPTSIPATLTASGQYTMEPVHFLGNVIESILDFTQSHPATGFGSTGTTQQRRAEQFTTGGSSVTCAGAIVPIHVVGNPTDNVILEIHGDSSGEPDETAIASVTIPAASLGVKGGSNQEDYLGYRVHHFDTPVSLSASTDYWLVASRSGTLNDTDKYAWSRLDFSDLAQSKYWNGSSWLGATFRNHFAILDDTHKVFSVGVYQTDTKEVTVTMATDPTSSFTAQDQANAPNNGEGAGSGQIRSIGYDRQFGEAAGFLPIITHHQVVPAMGDDTYPVEYHVFNLASNSWELVNQTPTGIETNIDLLNTVISGNEFLIANAFIGVRADGDMVIVYSGAHLADMGNDYSTIKWGRYEAGTWTINTTLHSQASTEYSICYAVMDADDRFNLSGSSYNTGSTSTTHWVDVISATNGTDLATTPSTGDSCHPMGSNTWHVMGPITRYDDSGTEKLFGVYVDDGTTTGDLWAMTWSSADTLSNADITTALISGSEVDDSVNSQFYVGCAVNGTDLHAVFWDNQATTVMTRDENTGSGWGTDSTGDFSVTGSTGSEGVAATVFDRGNGPVLAIIAFSGGTVEYDEYALSAAAAGTASTLLLLGVGP
jgi:hypothetical protein